MGKCDTAKTTERHDEVNDPPFFSIILPSYGVERFLSHALDDLVSQTFSCWEAIVVDDCSPDKSRDVAERFAAEDPRIRIAIHEENRGLSAARNTGLQKARGKYVWFPDPDDRYDKHLLEKVHASLEHAKSLVVLIGHAEEYYSGSNEPDNVVDFALQDAVLSQSELRKAVIDLEKKTQYGYAWNKIYERDYLIEGSLLFVEGLPLIEDIEFNIRAFQNLPSLNIVGEPLYRYAKREAANLTNKFVPEYYEVHRKRIQLMRDQQASWGLLDDRAKSILGALYARYIFSALERNLQLESQMDKKQQFAWCESVFKDPLFLELVSNAQADSAMLRVCIKLLQRRDVAACLRVARIIRRCKEGSFHGMFLRLKSKR